MADIKVNYNINTDTFSIILDNWEWTGLTVNGNKINPIENDPNVQFQYSQPIPGTVHFIATADHNIDLVNPSNIMYLKGVDNRTYMCTISYKETENPKIVTLSGVLVVVDSVIPGAEASPISFSQGKMTGTFQTVNQTTSLVGTEWHLSMTSQGQPVGVNINFGENGICSYGPYKNCTYTQTDSTFVIEVPDSNGGIQITKLTGSFANGYGQGELTHEMNGNPIGTSTPFTIRQTS